MSRVPILRAHARQRAHEQDAAAPRAKPAARRKRPAKPKPSARRKRAHR